MPRYFERWLLGAAMTVMAFVAERIMVRLLRPKAAAETPTSLGASLGDER